jgi:hypothetical protein
MFGLKQNLGRKSDSVVHSILGIVITDLKQYDTRFGRNSSSLLVKESVAQE